MHEFRVDSNPYNHRIPFHETVPSNGQYIFGRIEDLRKHGYYQDTKHFKTLTAKDWTIEMNDAFVLCASQYKLDPMKSRLFPVRLVISKDTDAAREFVRALRRLKNPDRANLSCKNDKCPIVALRELLILMVNKKLRCYRPVKQAKDHYVYFLSSQAVSYEGFRHVKHINEIGPKPLIVFEGIISRVFKAHTPDAYIRRQNHNVYLKEIRGRYRFYSKEK